MRFPFRFITAFEDATRNFEFLEASTLSWGTGAPVQPPQTSGGAYYLRLDKSLAANTRIYYWNGTAWAGIA